MTPAPRTSDTGSPRRPTARKKKKGAGSRFFLYGAAATIAVGLGLWALVAGLSGPLTTESSPRRVSRPVEPGAIPSENVAVLFYVDEAGTFLVEQEVEVPLGDTALARARLIAERQLAPPDPPLISPFPEGTAIRAIYIAPGGDAFIDLSPEVSTGHPGGSLDEVFTVYALVNALTRNVPEIAAVQILIEGREVDTLAGHVDLRRPLGLNMSWVSQGEAATRDGARVDDVAENL